MKPLIPILIVATTSLAVASVQLAHQASTQRERADAEMALRQKQDLRVAQLERSQARLERELAVSREAVGAPPPTAAGSVPPPPGQRMGGGRAVAAFAALEPVERAGPPPEVFRTGPRMMESPAARNFMRTRMKSSIRRMYEDAGSALGLSAEKSKQLLDLLADQQTRNIGPPNLADGQTIQQYMQDQQKKNNEEIKGLIGQDKIDDWAAYQKSLPDRAQLGQVRDQLEQAGVPMTESQRTDLLAAITEETQRNPRPAYTPGVPQEETMAQMNQWQSEYDKALLDRAKQVLNTEQFNAYKEFQDWQSEMRSSMRMMPGGPTGVVRMVSPGVAVSSATAGSNGLMPVAPTVSFSLPAAPVPQAERK